MEEANLTYIFSFKLKLEGGGQVTGRIEAYDIKDATQRASEQWKSYRVISGDVKMLANQEQARKKHFIAL